VTNAGVERYRALDFSFLNLRFPELTRALLRYRSRRLPEARQAARAAGYEGAMYPWQSGSDGARRPSGCISTRGRAAGCPTSPTASATSTSPWPTTSGSTTRSPAPFGFLSAYGAEMLLEIARFWASIASYDHDRDRHEIRGVMGPDEYHDGYPDRDKPGLDNNAYTNVMAAWVLCRALDTVELLPDHRRVELSERLGLAREELERWDEISRKLHVPFHDGDIISQFEGYGDLDELDWEGLRRRHSDIRRLDRILGAEGDSTNRYKASKPADVLMLFYLLSAEELRGLLERLGYRLEPAAIPGNVNYYLKRTSHGSTLSGVVNAWCWPAATGRGPGGSPPSRRRPSGSGTCAVAGPCRSALGPRVPGREDWRADPAQGACDGPGRPRRPGLDGNGRRADAACRAGLDGAPGGASGRPRSAQAGAGQEWKESRGPTWVLRRRGRGRPTRRRRDGRPWRRRAGRERLRWEACALPALEEATNNDRDAVPFDQPRTPARDRW
jgi:hypothetical protein